MMPQLKTYIIKFKGAYIGAYLAVVAFDKLEAVRLVRMLPLGNEIPLVASPEFEDWVKANVAEMPLELGYVYTIWEGMY